jgi:hypothetical protein
MQMIKTALLRVCNMTVFAPFWTMAFIAFLLRLFVVPPIGALLALIMGTVWCCGNAGRIRERVRNVLSRG